MVDKRAPVLISPLACLLCTSSAAITSPGRMAEREFAIQASEL